VRPSPQKEEEKARTRTALVRATLTLAAQHGFASLGLREVSREAGIAPTSFYRHFTDMRELGLALIDELVRPLLATLTERARSARAEGHELPELLVNELQLATAEAPEVMRFTLAERYGAIPEFRRALRDALKGLASALHGPDDALPEGVAEAAVAVLLDTCDALLDGDPGAHRAAREAALKALGWMLSHTGLGGRERG
jgi:AcrR family transcriptional regulator